MCQNINKYKLIIHIILPIPTLNIYVYFDTYRRQISLEMVSFILRHAMHVHVRTLQGAVCKRYIVSVYVFDIHWLSHHPKMQSGKPKGKSDVFYLL